jgi:hypothetical protein
MKKILLGMMVLGALASCKKDKASSSCETTVAGVANSFKLTKHSAEVASISQDIPLSTCELAGVYVLKADKTATYTETGTGCDTSVETGTWDVVNGKVTIGVGPFILDNMSTITWDCSNLTLGLSQSVGGITTTDKYNFVKL